MTPSALSRPLDSNFLVIAHRGARRDAPENTMAAFKRAHQSGADMIELDVHLSRDGVPVVFHDATLDNHTNGRGRISSFLFEELQQLDAGSWFSSEFVGEKIPSLQEVLDWAAGNIMLNIEIKPEAVGDSFQEGVEQKVVEIVRAVDQEGSIIISSFDYRAIMRVKQISSKIVTGLLYNRKLSGKKNPLELLEEYGADLFHCSKNEMSKQWIRLLQEHERRFLVYTVNRRKAMKKWLKNGAFGIFSDKPDVLKTESSEFFSNSA